MFNNEIILFIKFAINIKRAVEMWNNSQCNGLINLQKISPRATAFINVKEIIIAVVTLVLLV